MARRGVKFLILLSRSGVKSDAAKHLIDELKAAAIHVEAPACDISNKESLSAALEYCAPNMPPIRGCIQASMVLKVTYLSLSRC